ncbi:MAG: glucosamine 6-phosphate synthetase, contains amidotransferase and phosphosugar isomerase domain [Actinomycetia bacterium]|nr:glucosamine 6-phosphate synthetase, contains amidotransferase and phosphosugar isomerase domain [Actinomycetes bacterium]
MCGIVAVVRRRSERAAPQLGEVTAALDRADATLRNLLAAPDPISGLRAATADLSVVDAALRGVPGLVALLSDRVGLVGLEHRAESVQQALTHAEAHIDGEIAAARVDDVETLNAALVACKDAAWAVARDRLRSARAVEDLAGTLPISTAGLEAYHSIQVALSALDRLEVRGRDSAGLHLFVTGHGLDLAEPGIAGLLAQRSDPLFGCRSVRAPDGNLAFVYKTAAEIGELGDNTSVLRAHIRDDELLRLAVSGEHAHVVVLGHTRWASVGIISEANAHPLNQEEMGRAAGPYVTAALNGDVDNYADLKALESLSIPNEITTDAKVIPALVSRRLVSGAAPVEAFRSTVASFEGSVAIAAHAADASDRLLLAQRGSGQALYVGLADDMFIVASEPYGLVEEAHSYIRLDGESMLEPGNPATQGQIVALDAGRAGVIEGIERCSYDGRLLPVDATELQTPEITTRDVDRGDAPHYLLKEISEAPASFRKTLRGKIVEVDGRLDVRLPEESLPLAVRERVRTGEIQRVLVTGMGTAMVAAQSLALALKRAVAARPVSVEAIAATELSGFEVRDDMRDTLVIAISQSGTTTDTNRTVDVVRARGGAVVSIVNRRQSDLVDKSDGVLYTSDGRDVEMSVASTKAFYSQIAAGFLLAFALAPEFGADDDAARSARHEMLASLRELPEAMLEVVGRRESIAAVAQRQAPQRRSWAIVGNGVNRVAAAEVRIKLSELCYKSIACDVTEEKKHIDLSAEPLILVCAAGLRGSNADDVGKELAIYRAHKAAPIVVADDGETRLRAALESISVPVVHPDVAFVLSAMAGHLFGYEAALAIDASARPLREARGSIEAVVSNAREGDDIFEQLTDALEPLAARFFDTLRSGGYDGSLEAATAVRLATLLRYATGIVPFDSYQVEFGKVGTPSTIIEDLISGLTDAIEELTRPIDAIKHQAKTVTVGISRSDETLLRVRLVQEVLGAGVARDALTYRTLRTLVGIDPAVEAVVGFTRYRIEGEPATGAAQVHVVDRGGIALDIPTRTASNPLLRGTKHRVATEREVTVFRGRSDGRTLIAVPEVKGNQATGLTLLHVHFVDRLAAEGARRVLENYRDRYAAIADFVAETEPMMRDDVLGDIDVVDLLTEPILQLAERWRA